MALLDIYKVVWQNNRHKYPDTNTDYVAVTAGTGGAVAVASTLQTNNNDGKTVTILGMELIRKNVVN
jgi:hypothetical protein